MTTRSRGAALELATATEVARRLDEAGVRLSTPRDSARLMVQTLRLLARGRLVPMATVAELAADLPGGDEAVRLVEQMSEKDEQGNVVGFVGLSLNDHPHRFEVDGQELRTWCAWDALFLPPMLGRTAHVTSNDPATGEEIRLKVTPLGVERTYPEGVLVSVVAPETDEGHTWTAEEAQMLFCNFIHFFATREAAGQWFADREMPASFLSVDEAFKLGQIRFGDVLAHA